MKRTPLSRGTKTMKRSGFKTPSVKPKKAPRSRAKVKKVLTVTKLKKDLWQECRRITLLRYPEPQCFTCGQHGLTGSNRHLGHYISSSVCSVELRYDLDNLRWQCYGCNIHKSGNWLAYEKNLQIEKGVGFNELLKKRNEETKNRQYDILWYQQKLAEYKAL
jgi:hypothetical protein